MKKTNNHYGFSLVELSVVLIILALLAAGVTAGQSLVKGSKLRSVIKDIETFKLATETFVIQYDQLPGDIDDAHDFFDDGSNGVCGTAAQCNGDGDGRVELPAGGVATEKEGYRAWQHLNLAGMLEGNYTGVGETCAACAIVGLNIPASKYKPGGYSYLWKDILQDSSIPVYANSIYLGAERQTNNWYADRKVISAIDAYSIDKKIDDGRPSHGDVLMNRGIGLPFGTCTNGVAYPGTEYKLTVDTGECYMVFKIADEQ